MQKEIEGEQERIACLEKERETAKEKIKASLNIGVKIGEDETLKKITKQLDAGLSKKKLENLSVACNRVEMSEKKKLEFKIKQLKKRIEKTPTLELKKNLANVQSQLECSGTGVASLTRRQRVLREIDVRRWILILFVLIIFNFIVLMFGLNTKQEANEYKEVLLTVANDGLNGNDYLSKDSWDQILTIYNEQYGTDHLAGR